MYYAIDLSDQHHISTFLRDRILRSYNLPVAFQKNLASALLNLNGWTNNNPYWHITTYFGSSPNADMQVFLDKYINKEFSFAIVAIGYIPTVSIALKVEPLEQEYICGNKIPHITVAAYRGHSPVESNDIKIWYELDLTKKVIVKGKLIKFH